MSHLTVPSLLPSVGRSKTPLVGGQKHACIVPTSTWIARIDRRTADDQSMSLSRTAVVFQEDPGFALAKRWARCRSARV